MLVGSIFTGLIGCGVVGAFSSCSIEAVEAKPFNLICPYLLDIFSELRNAAEAIFALAGVTIRP